jgi:hypothetical protein
MKNDSFLPQISVQLSKDKPFDMKKKKWNIKIFLYFIVRERVSEKMGKKQKTVDDNVNYTDA